MTDSPIPPTGPSITKKRRTATVHTLSFVALVAAVLLRVVLDPWMGDTLPLVTLFGAVAAAEWLGGTRPAILVVLLGYIACDYLFIQPRNHFALGGVAGLIGLLAYLFTCGLIICFGEAARRAHATANERGEQSQEASTGRNLTAVANAKATRSVIYANSDSSKKVTISVDQYATASDASSAYQEAVAKSKTVPGFKPVHAENLGQDAFVGTVTQGGETHIGLGALHDALIVGATLAGYDLTPENTAKLVALTREEERVAKAAMDRNRQK